MSTLPTLVHNNPSLFEDTYHEIQERTLTLFTLSIGVIAWGIVLGTNIFLHDLETLHIFYGVLVVLVCGLAYSLKLRYFQFACLFFVISIWLLNVSAYVRWEHISFAYLMSTSVLLATSLLRLRYSFTIVMLSTYIVLANAPIDPIGPILFLWISLIVGQISMLRGFESFAIVQSYANYATDQMYAARERRGELVKITKLLREATENLNRSNRQLEYAHEVAKEARRLKAQFAANVSHELRTPINLIVGYSEVMAIVPEAYGETLPQSYRADIQVIYRNSRHLQNLINDILDISQIEAEQLGLLKEKSKPDRIIHEAANMVSELVRSKGLKLILDVPDDLPILWLDRTRIRQVLLNLLANAIRFTEFGHIRIRAYIRTKNLHITVSDTGLGIAQSDLEKVFEEFFHIDSTIPHSNRGTGLGLSLSQQFVKQHDGKIWVESTGVAGQGSQFTFTLPLNQALSDAVPNFGSKASLGANNTMNQLLVIDNDPAIVQLFERHIHKGRVMHAESPTVAEDIIRQVRPTAIVADVSHQEDLNRIIEYNSPQSILLTMPMPSGKRVAQAQGISEYLVKPINRPSLLQALDKLPQPIHRVLIIDDDPDILRLFERMLRSSTHNLSIHQSINGREGIATMRKQRPDLVLLDIVMPDIDGLGVLNYMKADKDLQTIPIIVISARGLEEAIIPVIAGEISITCPGGYQSLDLVKFTGSVMGALTSHTLQAPE